jgi:predicted  nucleic acid-binding Zn-ribbon protein
VNKLIENLNKISVKCSREIFNNLYDLTDIEYELDELYNTKLTSKINKCQSAFKDIDDLNKQISEKEFNNKEKDSQIAQMKKDISDYDEKLNQLQKLIDSGKIVQDGLNKQIKEREATIQLNLKSKNDLYQKTNN